VVFLAVFYFLLCLLAFWVLLGFLLWLGGGAGLLGRDVQLDAYFLAEVVAWEAVGDEGLEHVVFGRGGGVGCDEALVDEFVDLAG
jgi:hypothetical protein